MQILSRFTVTLSAVVLGLTGHAFADPPTCPLTEPTQRVEIAFVIDGDTLALKDGTRVRLIGVDTPELGKQGAADEPYSVDARDKLKTLFERYKNQAELVYDTDRTDRYRRTLAHVYVNQNISVQAWLLKSGLAFHLTLPPNLKNQACYFSYAQKSRSNKLGVWGADYFKPIDAQSIPSTAHGYRQVIGEVVSVKSARNGATWLNLKGGKFSAQVVASDLPLFNDLALSTLAGKRLTLQGYLIRTPQRNSKTYRFYVRLRHPDAIQIN